MSTLMQLAIPLLAAAGIMLAVTIIRKSWSMRSVVVMVSTVLIAVPCMIFGIGGSTDGQAGTNWSESRASLITEEQADLNLQIVGQMLAADKPEMAKVLIEDMIGRGFDGAQMQLAQARAAFLTGSVSTAARNYEAAKIAYEDAGRQDFPTQEYEQVTALASANNGSSAALIDYVQENGENPADYGLTQNTAADSVSEADVKKLILENAAAEVKQSDSDMSKAVMDSLETLQTINEQYEAFTANGYCDEDAAAEQYKAVKKLLKNNEELKKNRYYRLALLKASVMAQKYSEIAASLDSYATEEEMMIAAELYVKKLIKAKDFPELYREGSDAQIKQVYDHCKELYSDQSSEMKKTERNAYKELLRQLSKVTSENELVQVYTQMSDLVDALPSNLQSQFYLQMAKVQMFLENETQTSVNINNALTTAENSKDSAYADAMKQLQDIIGSQGESEAVKDISAHVQEALNHTLPFGMKNEQLPADEKAEEYAAGFETFMSNVMNEKSAIINIGKISTEKFPQVEAMVQVQSNFVKNEDEFKEQIVLSDCGIQIDDYTVEQVEYSTSRIILLVDCSGSMDESVEALKNAVRTFAENMTSGEEVCLIGFTDMIVFDTGFSSSSSEVAGFADQIRANGGTDMYSALSYAAGTLEFQADSNDIIILMTDGDDNYPASKETIYSEIPVLANDKGLTIYTMGMSSHVNTEYLSWLADAGLGSFLYMEGADSLTYFYNFIHNQLKNQYRVTFTAEDTEQAKRFLNLKLEKELTAAEREYSIQGSTENVTENDDLYTFENGTFTITGLLQKQIYRSKSTQTLTIKGSGIDTKEPVKVTISGSLEYTLQAKVMDANTIEIEIPYEVTAGTYDLTVSQNGNNRTLEDELTVSKQGTAQSFDFGDYHFQAGQVDVQGDVVTLREGVVMNGWLNFRGDVVLRGDYQYGEYISMEDVSGCYMTFSKNCTGLAGLLEKYGIPFSMNLGTRTLYKDMYAAGKNENFRVDYAGGVDNMKLVVLKISAGQVALYPQDISIRGLEASIGFPLQEQVLQKLPECYKKVAAHSGEGSADAIFSKNGIAMHLKAEYENVGEDGLAILNLPVSLSSLSIDYESMKNDGSVEVSVALSELSHVDNIIAGFGMKGGRFDSFQFGAEGTVTLSKAPVPVSLDKLVLGVSGMASISQDKSDIEKFFAATLSAEFQVSVAKAEELVGKKIADLIGDDPAVFTFEDCKLECTPADFSLGFDATAKAFEVIEIGKVHVDIGKFTYSNTKLGFYHEEEKGVHAAVTIGSTWESTNIELTLQGLVDVVIGAPFTGIKLQGDIGYDVRWFVFKHDDSLQGQINMGIYKNHYDELQFTLDVCGSKNNGKQTGFQINFTRAGKLSYATY